MARLKIIALHTYSGNAPVAVADSYTTNEDVVGGLVVNALVGVLSNDTDPDPGPNSRFVVDNDLTLPGIQPIATTQNGTLVLNVDGSFTYNRMRISSDKTPLSIGFTMEFWHRCYRRP